MLGRPAASISVRGILLPLEGQTTSVDRSWPCPARSGGADHCAIREVFWRSRRRWSRSSRPPRWRTSDGASARSCATRSRCPRPAGLLAHARTRCCRSCLRFSRLSLAIHFFSLSRESCEAGRRWCSDPHLRGRGETTDEGAPLYEAIVRMRYAKGSGRGDRAARRRGLPAPTWSSARMCGWTCRWSSRSSIRRTRSRRSCRSRADPEGLGGAGVQMSSPGPRRGGRAPAAALFEPSKWACKHRCAILPLPRKGVYDPRAFVNRGEEQAAADPGSKSRLRACLAGMAWVELPPQNGRPWG